MKEALEREGFATEVGVAGLETALMAHLVPGSLLLLFSVNMTLFLD